MPEETPPPPPVNRRRFLEYVAWGTAAAATGVGAGWLWPRVAGPESAIPATAVPVLANPAAVSTTPNNDLYAQLVAAQAETMRLQAALDAAQRRVAAFEQAQGQPTAVEEQLTLELGQTTEKLTLLTGLLGLYEQLDRLELGDKVEAGIATMGEALTNLVADLPTVEEGVALGVARLDEFAAHVPLLESGRSWLANHTSKMAQYYALFEQMLQTAVERLDPVLDMLQSWFDDILKWLPFGMGRTAVQVMSTLTDLIRETPNTIHGTETNIAQPLDVWLKKETAESLTPIAQRLFTPLREQALQPAQNLATKTRATKQLYEDEMVVRLGAAVANRRIIQELIAQYRANHGLE